ncbi:MAG: leucine-rich repeat domain-containing protein [Treponema sp.]|nr:leucine-rich repeat domain-containing protein [Treponema sp.]
MRKMKRKFARAFALAVLGMAAVWAVTARQGDFEIKHGVLVKYRGNAAEVVVPAGLTAIGERSFSECDKLNAITLQALKPPVLTS